jgi:hypothetical protein
MRDLFSSGKAEEVLHADDPFWDPPEPVEIGKAFVYLKALSHLVEIENDFPIVNFKGETDGELSVEIFPFGPDGEDLDYLQEGPSELIGMEVGWQIRVPEINGIPESFAHNVHIAFSFLEQNYESTPYAYKSTNPKIDYDIELPARQITEEYAEYLLHEPLVISVKGFREQVEVAQPTTLGQSTPGSICQYCEDNEPFFFCTDCNQYLCVGCDDLLHMNPAKASHDRVALGKRVLDSKLCSQCEEHSPNTHCNDCNLDLCTECFNFLHLAPSKKNHNTSTLGDLSSSPKMAKSMCDFCEEKYQEFYCIECEQNFCSDCNEFLHMSPAKNFHQRNPLSQSKK